ncbi:tRNA acetyltransferase TAN1 [Colletotrichum musicola]|uniref:tRNA acetyltransferase TAN1 n=1 Tax=Colletotrichum musicola TaxID=2175873 RepID=A0A8H6K8C1_9PEZI|nr:tRNA acetyltransferase TAN1 [Colletotrichum musicola]
MADSTKRKQVNANDKAHPAKRSKGGRGAGSWQTTHQKAKVLNLQDRDALLDVGDQGIWVTFARGMDGKAISEFGLLCDEYGKTLYGLVPPGEDVDSEEETGDIEASIEKELDGMRPAKAKGPKRSFKAIRAGIECVFFMKTRPPVDPVELCRRICQDASACGDPKERKTKYINRLTPVSILDKASENGVIRAARKALAPYFDLVPDDATHGEKAEVKEDGQSKAAQAQATSPTDTNIQQYAIRPSIRSNSSVDRDSLIKQIASVISARHKVNLGSPDRVILVDIFQSYCCMSVIEGNDWDGLKKLNVNELYKSSATLEKKAGQHAGSA